MGRGDSPIGLSLYTPLVIKIYNHSYENNLPTRLPLNRLPRLEGINPAKFGEICDFFSQKNSVITSQNITRLAQLETTKKIGVKAAGLDIKNHDFFSF